MKKLASYLVSALFLLAFAVPAAGQTENYFRIGVWCTQFPSPITDREKELIRILGANYLIACPRDEDETMQFCDEESNAGCLLRTNIERDPTRPDTSLWETFGRTAQNHTDPAWQQNVRRTIVSIDTTYGHRPGMADVLVAAEKNTYNPDAWPGFRFMCDVIDSIRAANSSNSYSVFQDGWRGQTTLEIIDSVRTMDMFMMQVYPFDDTPPTTEAERQAEIQLMADRWGAVNSTLRALPWQPSLIAILQADSTNYFHYRLPTYNEILCSVNLALSYGARGIVYYVYADVGAYGHGLLTTTRDTTVVYSRVRQINNAYLRPLSATLVNLNWQETHSVHNDPPRIPGRF